MRTTINQPSYLKSKARRIDKRMSISNVMHTRTSRVIELVVPRITYCPVMGASYSTQIIYLR